MKLFESLWKSYNGSYRTFSAETIKGWVDKISTWLSRTTSQWNVAKRSQWYVSTTSYWNVVATSQKHATTTCHQNVSTTSQTSLRWNTQYRRCGTSPPSLRVKLFWRLFSRSLLRFQVAFSLAPSGRLPRLI